MKKTLELSLSPEVAGQSHLLKLSCAEYLNISEEEISHIQTLRKSIDARKKVVVNLKLEVFTNESFPESPKIERHYQNVSGKTRVVIIGAGPAGLFAALRLIELGFKPVILERGKDVQARRRDIAAINKDQHVNPDSNYCFGEGGAGTYSDGKLYTRAKKRGNILQTLETLVAHGATEQILIDTHPHIGTNKLPKVVQSIRESILNAGGEIHFNTKVTDINVSGNLIKCVVDQHGNKVEGKSFILATGHSARDIYQLLKNKNIELEFKPFALGVRVEHPQELIDRIQYKRPIRGPYLPAASYSLVTQIMGKGVFSFCMCPGGFIVPAATTGEEIVTNGMSPSRRDSKYANSGIVMSIDKEQVTDFHEFGVFAGLEFQKTIERNAWIHGGKTQHAPAQRLVDFCNDKSSSTLPDSSYQPGLTPANLNEVLLQDLSSSLKKGLQEFGKKLKGYYTNEAVVLGVESRTSSPVRIPRDASKLYHPQILNMFPSGEGAGYAGGILSAAMDGEKVAQAVAELSH